MSTATNILFYPLVSLKRRFGRRNRAAVNDCPPPTEVKKECVYGEYCIKSEVLATDPNGEVKQTFIGYSGDMNITIKTKYACERFKEKENTCGDPTMVIKGGDCEEAIFVKNRAGMMRKLPMF